MELMDGLTLLSTSVQNNAPLFWCLTVFTFIILLMSACLTIICAIEHEWGSMLVGIFFMILSLLLTVHCFDETSNPPVAVYKVTIDESVSMVEFCEHYEIINQDGLIFTITEKEVS